MEERRKFQRTKVSFIVIYRVNSPITVRIQIGAEEADAIALDLSEGGMAIITKYEIPAATLVTLKFIIIDTAAVNIEERTRVLEIAGEVCYVSSVQKLTYRLGIKFMELTADDRAFIAHFVTRNANP